MSEITHRQKGSFGTAFGMSSGCLLGAGFVLIGIPLLICGGCVMIGLIGSKRDSSGPAGTSPGNSQAPPKNAPPAKAPAKVAADNRVGVIGKEIRFGEIGVTVERARINTFTATSPSGRLFISDANSPNIVVIIALKNYDENKLVQAHSQSGKATLTDEHGNNYTEEYLTNEFGMRLRTDDSIGFGNYIELRSDGAKSTDVVVFQNPVPGAKMLTLTIDASMYGGDGKIVYKLKKEDFVYSAK